MQHTAITHNFHIYATHNVSKCMRRVNICDAWFLDGSVWPYVIQHANVPTIISDSANFLGWCLVIFPSPKAALAIRSVWLNKVGRVGFEWQAHFCLLFWAQRQSFINILVGIETNSPSSTFAGHLSKWLCSYLWLLMLFFRSSYSGDFSFRKILYSDWMVQYCSSKMRFVTSCIIKY